MAKEKFYTSERNVQIVLSLLKANGIRKIIASPGATNFTFVGSVQNDPFFEVYSAVDERSAAYMACGMAAESGEAVALSCTGATASRNYYPGLTEAFYRKLPVLAITSHQGTDRIGQLIPQNIDRRILPNDIARLSVELPVVKDCRDEDYVVMEVNKAMLELRRNGGGPVHINLITTRKGHEEYTKYSFPSKTMEYMASGTPTIMYKLPGLPIEYEEYLVLLPDNSQETLTAILKQWGSKTQAELYEFGEKAKRFILENKNSEIQASRLMNFIKHS